MSEFLGTSSEKSEECSLTFPKTNGNEQLHVDDEIDMITKRIEFLRDMVDSPSRNTPTVIINRRGASQDEYEDEDVENTTPHQTDMRQVARDTIRQPFRRIDIANVRQKSKDSNIPRSMSPRPYRQGQFRRIESQSPVRRQMRPIKKHIPQWDDTPDRKGCTMRKLNNFSGKEIESWQDWLMSFERTTRNAGLFDDEVLAMRFSECLSGVALSFYNRMTIEEQESWQLTKALFNSRFGVEGYASQGRSALNSLRIKERESAVAYKQRFVEAWERAYPSHGGRTNKCDELMVDKFIETIQDREACMFIGQQRPRTVDQACEALDSWLMGRDRVSQQNVYAGFKSTAVHETLANKKPMNTPENSEIQRLTSELNELKKSLDRVLQSQKDRKSRQNQRQPAGQRQWRSPPAHIREKYNLPVNMKRQGCWWCGADSHPRHSIRDCPVRLGQEAQRPGSTYKKPGPVEHARIAGQEN
jgi:hypothetical protein